MLKIHINKATKSFALIPISILALTTTVYLTNTSKPPLDKLAILLLEEDRPEENEVEIFPKPKPEKKDKSDENESSSGEEEGEEGDTQDEGEEEASENKDGGEPEVSGGAGGSSNSGESQSKSDGEAPEDADLPPPKPNTPTQGKISPNNDDEQGSSVDGGEYVDVQAERVAKQVVESVNTMKLSNGLYDVFSIVGNMRKMKRAIKKLKDFEEGTTEELRHQEPLEV